MNPKDHILSIRQRLTGENSSINTDGILVVEHLNQMLTRAISELAKNIYKKDSHFVMELIQNADDNNYSKGKTPTLKIIQTDKKIIFKNNEIGFNSENVESICNISKSTKGGNKGIKGYIGEKGIGFKSVFRVSNEPEIYSNGYQFKFYGHSNSILKKPGNKLGFILPEWIEEHDEDIEAEFTNVVLPFKKGLSPSEKLRLADIEPDLILFLNKLQRLEINNHQLGVQNVVSKTRKGDLVTILQEKSTIGEEKVITRKGYYLVEREIKVPVNKQVPQRKGVGSTKVILAFPIDKRKNLIYEETQKAYSFLPIIESGFRFLIQADFILTSGRESIDEDNIWNHFIKDEIVNTFKKAVDEFKKNPLHKFSFINYVPNKSEKFSDFFQSLADDIIEYCKSSNIVISESNKWCKPNMVYSAEVEEVDLFENILLKKSTGKEFLSKSYFYNEELFDTLEIEIFSNDDICNCLKSTSFLEKKEIKWFLKLFSFLSKNFTGTYWLNVLKQIKIIPIEKVNSQSYILVAFENQRVFFPLDQVINYSFENSLNTFSKYLFNEINQIKNNSEKKVIFDFLLGVGIRYARPLNITRDYILKKYETNEWKDCSQQVLIDHLLYIKDHWLKLKDYQNEIINLLKDKNIIYCKNIGDGKNYFSTISGVYISEDYGNKNSLEKMFSRIENIWFINESYIKVNRKESIKSKSSEQITKEWYSFFKSIGCKEFPNLIDDSSEKDILKVIESGDPNKINHLLIIFEKHWFEFKKIFNSNNVRYKKWYQLLTKEKFIPIGNKLYFSKDVYIRNEKNKLFFGDSVNYYPRNILLDLAKNLGFNTTVDAESIIRYLKESSEKSIKITKEQANKIYKYLLNEETANLTDFQNASLIYLSERQKWFSIDELFWIDYKNIFGKEYGYCSICFPSILKEFFVDKIGVLEKPQINHFIDLLIQLNDANQEREVTAKEKDIIYKVFSELGLLALNLTEEEQDSFEELKSNIWTNKMSFWKNDNDIFYNDNKDLFELFKDEETISFFDIPDNILPRTKILLSIIDVPSISEAVKADLLNEDNAVLDEQLTKKVRKYSDAIISYVYSEYTLFYEENKKSNLFERFKSIEIYESPEIQLKYTLNSITKLSNADSFQKDNRIVLSRNNNDKISALAFEIAKYFNTPKLFDFALLLLTLHRNGISFFLKQKNITPPPEESNLVVDQSEIEFDEIDLAEELKENSDNLDFQVNQDDDFDEEDDEVSKNQSAPELEEIVNKEKWVPEVGVTDIDVNIEQYLEEEKEENSKEKEGRVFSKNNFNNSRHKIQQSKDLSKEDKDKIGDFGEKTVYNELIRCLKGKYPSYKSEHDIRNRIFRVSKNGQTIAELRWLNSKNTIQEGYDLILRERGLSKFYEVKTTRGPENVVFTLSPQQWNFIKSKENKYSIMRVINAGTVNIRIIEINNPYRLWREGKLKASPVSIEL